MERPGLAAVEAVLHRERSPYQRLGVRRLSPVIGAEVEGLDLRRDPSPEEIAELRRAFQEHHVLVFRDQLISESEHLRVAEMLGLAAKPPRRRVTTPDRSADGIHDPVLLGDSWRADETFRRVPPVGGALHIQPPPRQGAGGDMVFANMHLAYDLLSAPLKALLSDLTALHVSSPGEAGEPGACAEHPVVLRHPVTGRPALFVNRLHTSRIVQLDPVDSDSTLAMLCRHLEAHPVLTCRVRWTPNALVVWDNHCTQHLTLQDFRPGSASGYFVPLVRSSWIVQMGDLREERLIH